MKRTKNINKAHFRKKLVVYRISLLFAGLLGASLFLTGCDDTTTTQTYLDRPYTDKYDCYKNSDLSLDACTKAENQAVEDAKNNRRFNSAEDCLKDNPENDCRTHSSGGHSYFYSYPHYYGYNSATGTGQAFYQGRTGGNHFTSSKGGSFSPKTSSVPRTTTVTRGGFGSSMSSHSSSSHSSFGG